MSSTKKEWVSHRQKKMKELVSFGTEAQVTIKQP